MEKTTGFALKEAVEMGRRSANTAFYQVELKEQLKQQIQQRIKVHAGILERKEVATVKCNNCDEQVLNLEYTRGMITAFNQMVDMLNDNN